MKQYTNDMKLSLPIAIWALMDNYNYDERDNVISATGILKPTIQIVLGRKYKDSDMVIEASNLIASSMGTALHDSVEKAWSNKDKVIKILDSLGYLDSEALYDEVILERRSEKEINGYIISGQFDIAYNGYVCDIKSTTVWSYIFGSKNDDYIKQLSIYRWLNQDIIKEDKAYIEYIFTDWSAVKALQDSQYPQARTHTMEIKLLSVEDTEKMIIDKLAEVDKFMNLPDRYLILCSDEELWREESKWKFYKYNNDGKPNYKRATKVFDNERDAMNMASTTKGEIKHFKGGVKRCKYCNYTQICNQYIELKLKGEV
jgi:hypothetical protein